MRELLWSVGAWDDYLELQTDKAALKKVNKLLKDVMRNGYQASYGKVEMLKGNFRGYASVRIDHKNRLIFRADEVTIYIAECGGHYDERGLLLL